MSTLNYNGIEYNILYIDSSIASAGDGSTPALALANIPSPLVDKTCYIIRRTEDDEVQHVDMPQSWYETLYDIMFIGMPKSDNPMWEFMESDAKTAWGSDTGKWARIRCNMSSYHQKSYNNGGATIDNTTNMTLFKSSSIRSFIADTCYFYRDGESGSTDSHGCNLDYMFAIMSNNANVVFNNCKFGYTQYNLENDDYIANNEDISTDTIKYPQYKCKGYMLIKNADCATFNNCIINHVYNNCSYTYFSGDGEYTAANKTIVVYDTKKMVFTNNQYNILYRNSLDSTSSYDYYNAIMFVSYTGSSTSTSLYLDDYYNPEFILSNLEINKIFTSTNARYGARDIIFRAYKGKAENIKYNFKVMGGGTLENVQSINSRRSVWLHGLNSLYVNDFQCDYSSTNIASMQVLGLYSLRTNCGNVSSKIQNINIKMDTNGTINLSSPLLYIQGNSSEYRSADSWENSNNLSTIQNDSKTWIADNVILDAPNTSSQVLQAYRCGIRSPYIKGRVALNSATLDVDKIYNYFPTEYGVVVEGNSYLKCNEYWADISKSSYTGQKQMNISYDSLSSVYVYKTNSIIFDENPTYNNYEGSLNTSFVCPNYILDGQFFGRTSNNFCKSWNVLRTGSTSQGSLRFNNNYSAIVKYSNPMVVGQDPYKGIQIVPTTTGKKIITAYFACKNFDDSEFKYGKTKLNFEITCPEVKTDFYDSEKTYLVNHTYSSSGYAWQIDNSTWSNDTNLVAYKVEIPVEVFTTEETIDVKIWFNWYSVNGVVYVDPDFKIRDVA